MNNREECSSFETIVFMFDLIINAEQRELTIARFTKLMDMFTSMVNQDFDKARPVLSTHVMTALLEASDEQEQQLSIYKQVHSLAIKVYPADSYMLTKLKIQSCPIYVRA
jgi:hypothetical protein